MGISWQAIEDFFLDDSFLNEKILETQKQFLKMRGMWDEKGSS